MTLAADGVDPASPPGPALLPMVLPPIPSGDEPLEPEPEEYTYF